MNDLVQTDEELWETGKRDLDLLLQGLNEKDLAYWRVVELGCGVGRLLRSAAPLVKELVAVDCSQEAIALARSFTSFHSNISFLHGNGTDLREIQNDSIDLIFSFGLFAHLPYVVSAAYLRELHRIVRVGGVLRLQLFVGKCAPSSQTDVLAYRSYSPDSLGKAFDVLGWEVGKVIDVPYKGAEGAEEWLVPKIYALKKTASSEAPPLDLLSHLLNSEIEPGGHANTGSYACYIIGREAAFKYIEWGRLEEARHVLSYAVSSYQGAEAPVVELLKKLDAQLS